MRQLAQHFKRVCLARIDECIGAEFPRPLQALHVAIDGDHAQVSFDGTKTAPRTPYAQQAQIFDDGPHLSLMDARHLRFCDRNGKVWTLVARTDDPDVRAMFLSQVHNCPAGCLVAFDKAAGRTIEQYSPLVALTSADVINTKSATT
jgi:hypothetical protein